MKKLAVLLALISTTAFGQGVFFNSNVTTAAKNVPPGAQAPVYTLPYAKVTVCGYPSVGTDVCTNITPIYSDQDLAPEHLIPQPLVADSEGRFQFWIDPTLHSYSIQTPAGKFVGTWPLSLNSQVGPQGPGGIGCGATNCIIASPAIAQTISQPVVSGAQTTLSVNSLNKILNASLFPGSDIGAQINAAFAALGSFGCGSIYVPQGTYTFTTTIHIARCTVLTGAGALNTVLNYTATSGTALIVSDGTMTDPPFVNGYSEGYVGNIQLKGSGSSNSAIGVYIGGNPTCTGGCTSNPSGYFGDHFNFEGAYILNFGKGVTWGNNAWSNSFIRSIIVFNNIGINFAETGISNSGESISFIATSIQNNAIGIVDNNFGTISLLSSRCDYNTTECAQIGNAGQLYAFGSHFESLQAPFIVVPANDNSPLTTISIESSTMVTGTGSDPTSGFINVPGNSIASIAARSVDLVTTSTVPNFIRWAPSTLVAAPTYVTVENLTGTTISPLSSSCFSNFIYCRVDGAVGGIVGTNSSQQYRFGVMLGNGALRTTADANTLTDCGWYDGANLANAPTSGFLQYATQCSNDPTFLHQIAYNMSDGTNRMYVRQRNAGTWGPWQAITFSNVLQSSDTSVTPASCTPNGYITTNLNGITVKVATCP